MKSILKTGVQSTVLLIAGLAILSGCQVKVRDQIPAAGKVRHEQVVYVENDGRCPQGQVIKITGGDISQNIPRIYECVERP